MLTPKKVSCLNLVSIPDIHQDPSWVSFKLALPEDPKKWTIDQVCEWASTVIESEHAQKLKPQEIDGSSLFLMTKLGFESCGIPGGPATNLMNAIEKLKPQSQKQTQGIHRFFSPVNFSLLDPPVKVFNSLEEFFGVPSFEPQTGIDPVKCSEIGVHRNMGFKGREEIIAQIRQAVEKVLGSQPKSRNELVVLHGVPGSGKTKSFEALLQTMIGPDLFTIGVTFNSPTPIGTLERSILEIPGSDLYHLLGIRLLCILSRMLNKPVNKNEVSENVVSKSLELRLLNPELIFKKILAVTKETPPPLG